MGQHRRSFWRWASWSSTDTLTEAQSIVEENRGQRKTNNVMIAVSALTFWTLVYRISISCCVVERSSIDCVQYLHLTAHDDYFTTSSRQTDKTLVPDELLRPPFFLGPGPIVWRAVWALLISLDYREPSCQQVFAIKSRCIFQLSPLELLDHLLVVRRQNLGV